MSTRLLEILTGAALAIGFVGLLAWGSDSCHRKQGTQAEQQAAVHQGAANEHQAQAQAADHQAEDLKAQLAGAQERVDRLRQELARLRGSVAPPAGPGPVDHPPADPSGGQLPDPAAAAVIGKQSELIQAQDEQIQGLKAEVVVLTQARDEWKKTAEEREKQAMAQAAATEAWKKAVTESKWSGRVQGFAAGLALGYVGGRVQR